MTVDPLLWGSSKETTGVEVKAAKARTTPLQHSIPCHKIVASFPKSPHNRLKMVLAAAAVRSAGLCRGKTAGRPVTSKTSFALSPDVMPDLT